MIEKTIKINLKGGRKKKTYYYWDSYNTYKEALYQWKKLKEQWKTTINLKRYIIETKEGWFLPVATFHLYFNKDLQTL